MAMKRAASGGKRMAQKDAGQELNTTGKRSAAGAVIAVCAVLFIAAVYAGLCLWAGAHVLPNSSVLGMELGGLSLTAAEERLAGIGERYAGQTLGLVCGETRVECELDKAQPSIDAQAALEPLCAKSESFLRRGIVWVQALLNRPQTGLDSAALSFGDPVYMDGLLTELTGTMSDPVEQHRILIDEDEIRITTGHAGQAIDTSTLEERMLARLAAEDHSDLEMEVTVIRPDELDLQALYSDIYTEPANAALDGETFEITPSVTGVSFDLAQAGSRYAASGEDETFAIPLIFTEPEITTEKMEESLFADVLGEGKSSVSGSSGRKANVKLAGELCDGTILLPGEEFAYWSMIAPCTKEQGFQEAPTYLNGQTVPGVGGGVCQVSSTIYTACLYANLEIVERRNHTYAVGYLPEGSDAMVSEGASDFRFRNNTDWPIKLVITMENSKLKVQILGTKTDDTYVKMEFNNLSSNPFETVYQIDDTVPAGTTKVKVTGYTGYKNETYRCIYSGDGTLISRTLESKNSYARRDKIVLINSADAYKYGLDTNGEKLPEGTPASPSPAPSPSPSAVPEPAPSPAETLEPSAEPEPSDTSEMPDWLKP